VLRPVGTIDRSQAWFWTEEWQRREREASDDIKAGRTIKFASGEELLRYLDELAKGLHVVWRRIGDHSILDRP
jgi:antitoxin MazE